MLRRKPQDRACEGLVFRCPPGCDVALQGGCSVWRKLRDKIQHALDIGTGELDVAR